MKKKNHNKAKAAPIEAHGAPMNRAIKTGSDDAAAAGMMRLSVLADTHLNGSAVKKGESVTVSKSEARRLLTVRKDHFRIA